MEKELSTIEQATDLDSKARRLIAGYKAIKIKASLELAKILKEIRDKELYLKLDENSYPSFPIYVESLDYNYKTAAEIIGLYEAYVLTGGKTIDELATIGYTRLTKIKTALFKKEDGGYTQKVPKEELDKWLDTARSDISQRDLVQLKKEEEVGQHDHDWIEVKFKKCTKCGLKEYGGTKKL